MQEIITRVAASQQETAPMPLAGTLISIIKELELPRSEAVQFGNTVFITHYSEDGKSAVMRALNIDSAANYMKNGELYTRRLIKQGVRYFMTIYKTESFGIPFKLIEKNHLGQVLSGKTVYGDFETHVLLNAPKGKKND